MEDVTRKRVLRKLEGLPEEQLYQVLDYIEFLEMKYASAVARKPDPFQQFAERVEDQMRIRALAPKAMRGTMRLMSQAGKVLDGVRDIGRDIVGTGEGSSPASRSASRPSTRPTEPPQADSPVAPPTTGHAGENGYDPGPNGSS